MRASIVIAAHDEGHLLDLTLQSCMETMLGLKAEFVIADDASSDGSVAALARRFSQVRVCRSRRRLGTAGSKDMGARKARGDVLVFLDGHCKPEPWALERLVNDVENSHGAAAVTPRIHNLDPVSWSNNDQQVGYGYTIDLQSLDCTWLDLDRMRRRDGYYETPSLCGCCFAVSRDLYFKVRGFDRHMLDWGVEDLDFALKAWLVGEGVLHDPYAAIGHRFRTEAAPYSIRGTSVPINKLRMARKCLGDRAWEYWLQRFRQDLPEEEWQAIWAGFTRGRRSAERERRHILRVRKRDEYWYADRFGLCWPRP